MAVAARLAQFQADRSVNVTYGQEVVLDEHETDLRLRYREPSPDPAESRDIIALRSAPVATLTIGLRLRFQLESSRSDLHTTRDRRSARSGGCDCRESGCVEVAKKVQRRSWVPLHAALPAETTTCRRHHRSLPLDARPKYLMRGRRKVHCPEAAL